MFQVLHFSACRTSLAQGRCRKTSQQNSYHEHCRYLNDANGGKQGSRKGIARARMSKADVNVSAGCRTRLENLLPLEPTNAHPSAHKPKRKGWKLRSQSSFRRGETEQRKSNPNIRNYGELSGRPTPTSNEKCGGEDK